MRSSTNRPRPGQQLLLCLLVFSILATPAAAAAQTGERPTLSASRASIEPTLDGNVIDDPAWNEAEVTSGFTQINPQDGEPASEKTEIRILFDDEHLYVGVVCYDREPDRIIVSDARRDASLNDTDSFQFILDTFSDEQNGFVFGTNPAGIEYDGQVAGGREALFGGGSRFQGGSSAGFNLNWDAAWNVAATRGDFGWSAEFRIPFRTLRYPRASDGEAQSWGVNFQRNIRRRNETSFWASMDRNLSLIRLTEAGTVTGLEPPPQRNLKLIPYALGQGRRQPETVDGDTDYDAEFGIDIKYSLTPGLTLDATLNTDFAQVEVDEQQVNLDRFNLFFPEKRPFFLENAGLFALGASATGSRAAPRLDLFFSRRIGLGPSGELIPIEIGARLSGKVGHYNVGFLDMQTDDIATEGIQANNYAVARVAREFRNRSSMGVLAVQRQGTGSLAPDGDRNRVFALDGQLGIGEYNTLQGFVAKSDTPGLDGDDHAYHLRFNHGSPNWRAFVNYLEAATNFDPQVGFSSRESFRHASAFAMRTILMNGRGGFQEFRPHVSISNVWDYETDELQSQFIHIDNHFEWRNSWELHTGINLSEERVFEPFEIAEDIFVQPGEYSHEEAQIVFFTDQSAPLSFNSRTIVGGFFGGDRLSTSVTLQARSSQNLTSELTWNHNNVNLPVGDFDVNLGRLRVSYSITPRMLVQGLLQYNDRTDEISTNLRFSWLQDANTGLFIVYNEIDEFGARGTFLRPDRSLTVKYSYLFDVFGR